MTKVIGFVISIDTFEQKCVVLKGMLKSPRLKDRVQTIGIEQYLSNNYIYEHNFLENIKKLYKQAGNYDDQQQFKDIIESGMVSTSKVFTDNIPISPMTSTPFKKPSAQKSLCMFTNILKLKQKTAYCLFGAAKSKRKAINFFVNPPWALKQKRKGNSKIDEQIKSFFINGLCIIHNSCNHQL